MKKIRSKLWSILGFILKQVYVYFLYMYITIWGNDHQSRMMQVVSIISSHAGYPALSPGKGIIYNLPTFADIFFCKFQAQSNTQFLPKPRGKIHTQMLLLIYSHTSFFILFVILIWDTQWILCRFRSFNFIHPPVIGITSSRESCLVQMTKS